MRQLLFAFILIITNHCFAQIIWTDDFSNPSNWSLSNTGTNAAGWEFSLNPSIIPFPSLTPMASSTASNGFLFVSSEANNTSDFDGTDIITTATNVTPIDLSVNPYVKLKYQHNFRWWNDTRGVRISADNGNTWVEFEMTNENTYSLPSISSENPEKTEIDISSVAGGSSQVLIQFYYDDNDYWGWYWAVDDVSIEVLPDYDLELVPIWGSTSSLGARIPYYQIPESQIAPISFSGVVKNIGALIQNDINVTTTLGTFSSSSLPSTIAPGVVDTLNCQDQWTPVIGVHNVYMSTASGQQDANPFDNSFGPINLTVGGSIYSRDNGIPDGLIDNAGQGFEVGNIYEIYSTSTIEAITAHIHNAASLGAEIYAKLYSFDNTGDFVFANESAPYVLTAADIDADLTLPLLTEQSLNAGELYLVVIGSYGDGGASNDLVISTSGVSEAQTSFFMTNQTWFYTTSTPMVRMNLFNLPTPAPQICIVGLDSITNKNRVVWEKPLVNYIDSFYVYKETTVGNVYEKIGALSYSALAVFLDVNSNPAVQAYRYKISALDTSGNQTSLSDAHKTIHLTINQGVGGVWNLIWSNYEGLNFGTYNIYRGTDPSNMTLLTSIQNTLSSYTDLTAPSGLVYYQIEIVNPSNCDPTKSINYGNSRSNIVNSSESGIAEDMVSEVAIYPNPAYDFITMEVPSKFIGETFYVKDYTGRTLKEGVISSKTNVINLSHFSSGAYFIVVKEYTLKIGKR